MEFITEKKERISYYLYYLGQNSSFFFVTAFLSVYFVQRLGIPPATVALILLVARLWDALNDPMLSILIEKANFKTGKFQPWIRVAVILLPIFTILLFSFTDFLISSSMTVKVLYVSIVYILWGMTYTVLDAPCAALPTVAADTREERSVIYSNSKLFGTIGILMGMALAFPLIGRLGGWTQAAIFYGLFSIVFMTQVFRVKERFVVRGEAPTIKQIVKAIISNKNLVALIISLVVVFGLNFSMALTPFIASDVFGDKLLTPRFMIASFLPIIFIAPFMPRLVKKFGKNKLLLVMFLGSAVLSLLMFLFARNNATLFLILLVFRGIAMGGMNIIPSLFFADSIDYTYYKTGKKYEAATFAAQTFSNKLFTTISGSLAMFLIGVVGYQAAQNGQAVTQTKEAVEGLWATYNFGSIIGGVLGSIIFITFYKLNEEKLSKMHDEFERTGVPLDEQ